MDDYLPDLIRRRCPEIAVSTTSQACEICGALGRARFQSGSSAWTPLGRRRGFPRPSGCSLAAPAPTESPLSCFSSGRVHPNLLFQQAYAFTPSETRSFCVFPSCLSAQDHVRRPSIVRMAISATPQAIVHT